MKDTHQGFLLISDISGYTTYLNESELEHAKETLTDLLQLLVEKTRPPLVISRLAGDAVISYCLRDSFILGQTFVESIEDSYVAFRKAINLMVLNNTCQCNACMNVNQLDLKFFVHHGQFAIQHIGGHDELVGPNVNIIHRLLKNSVSEETGLKAYTLYTTAAWDRLDLGAPGKGLIRHREVYEDVGAIEALIQDMHAVWKNKREESKVKISADQVGGSAAVEIALPPEVVWSYLTDSEARNLFVGADKQVIERRQSGRVAEGTVYQCYHGDKTVPQTVLEWAPFERIVTRQESPLKGVYFIAESRLTKRNGETLLRVTASRPHGPLIGRLLMSLMMRFGGPAFHDNLRSFGEAIEAQVKEGGGLPELSEVNEAELQAAAAEELKQRQAN